MVLHLVSRKTAKEYGLTRYFTGKPCKFGHIAEKYTKCGLCNMCALLYSTERVKRPAYTGKISSWGKKWRDANKDRCKQLSKKWRENNRGLVNSHIASRRARKLQATPPWYDHDLVVQFYNAAQELTELTGIQFHVDHIIPLCGKNVSGLHVQTNLQILPYYENLSKSNNFSSVSSSNESNRPPFNIL